MKIWTESGFDWRDLLGSLDLDLEDDRTALVEAAFEL